MSNEEELTALGSLVIDASETNKRVTALRSRLETFSKALNGAHLHVNGVLQEVGNPELEAAIGEIPSAERVLAACQEFRIESKRARELKARIAGLGLL